MRLYPSWLHKRLPIPALYLRRARGMPLQRFHGVVTALGHGYDVWFFSEKLGTVKVPWDAVDPLCE